MYHCRKDRRFKNEDNEIMLGLHPRMYILENFNSKMVSELMADGGTEGMWKIFEENKKKGKVYRQTK